MMFDCSGFVYRVCRDVGLASSRQNYTMGQYDNEGKPLEGQDTYGNYYITAHTQEQRYYGEDISTAVKKYMDSGDYSDLYPGDLLFITNDNSSVSHVVIYAGNGIIIHSEGYQGYVAEHPISRYHKNNNGSNWYFDGCRLVPYCNHSYNNVGVCTSTCKKEFDFQSTYKMDDAGIYTVNISSGIYLRPDKPYAAAEASTTKIKYGTEVEVLGSVTNAFDNKWYKVSYNGEIGYTSADNLTFKRYDAQRITGSITSPMEGSQVPKAAYSVPISGTITSKYPLKEIKAYVDGHCFVTVPLGNTLTYALKGSLIEQIFDLSSLSLGYHTLTLEAKDIFHNEYTEVCSRSFVTVSADAGKVQAICCDMTSPTEGAQVPKEAYSVPIAGTITSNYPLKEIKAYVDGHCFVTVPLGSVTTYELEGSLIEQLFDLSSLNLGPHTLTLEARDIYHDEFVEICSRSFTTVMPGAICEHSYYEISRVEPTCVQYGYVTYGCFYCDYSYQVELAPNNEHNYIEYTRAEPDCETAGYIYYLCSVCGGDSYIEELPAIGHDIWTFYEEATCESPEQWLYVCNACGYTYTEEISPSLGHDYSERYVEPTCNTAGYIVYTCQRCGYEYEEIVSTPAHKYDIIVVPPTCTTDGFTVHRCRYCGQREEYITDYVPALGHSYDVVTKSPTCVDEGVQTIYCPSCGEVFSETVIPTLSHQYTSSGVCSICGERDPNHMEDILKGDINGDGTINGKDSNLIKQYIAGVFQSIMVESCDLYQDGQIDAKDSNLLLRIIAGN